MNIEEIEEMLLKIMKEIYPYIEWDTYSQMDEDEWVDSQVYDSKNCVFKVTLTRARELSVSNDQVSTVTSTLKYIDYDYIKERIIYICTLYRIP